MKKRLILSSIIIIGCSWAGLFAANSLAAADKPGTIIFAPVNAINIPPTEAGMIVESLRKRLFEKSGLPCKKFKSASDASGTVDSVGVQPCASPECISGMGKQMNASYVVACDIGRIGALFSFTVGLYLTETGECIQTREYEFEGTIEEFFKTKPDEAAQDIVSKLFPQTLGLKNYSQIEGVKVTLPTQQLQPAQFRYDRPIGIVAGPTFGVWQRVAIGNTENNQSRWGAGLMLVLPTTPTSQIRLKLEYPLSLTKNEEAYTNKTSGDIYTSIEHEWAWQYIAADFGIALMYMREFQGSGYYYANNNSYPYNSIYTPITINVPSVFAANWIMGIRAGRPNGGFRARVSWPIPFLTNWNTGYSNYLFEYSAMGIFGTPKIKGGVGIQGMYKSRENYSNGYNSYAYSMDFSQYFIMFPCGKLAFLISPKVVSVLSLDLGGIFLPSDSNNGGPWGAPSIKFDVVFSLKPFTGADGLDGTF